MRPYNDDAPEQDQSFIFKLTSAIPLNGDLGSSKHSSSAIMESSCNITITNNDDVNGLFQVMAVVPNITSSFIRSRSHGAFVNVEEEVGSIDLYIVRTQGTKGLDIIL